jgi:N-acetylglucosamine-6-sulfatase
VHVPFAVFTGRRVAVVAVLIALSFVAQVVRSAVAGSVGSSSLGAVLTQTAPAAPPNIVLIVTDDQRADTLRYMPIVRRQLGAHGVTFEHGHVVNPVCCPSRATMLTGLYSHSTGVYTNHSREPYGGFPAFSDTSTVSTWLDEAGYRTALIGKYLNGYDSSYVPPGWDRWFVTYGEGGYYDYDANSDGRLLEFGDDREDYGTTVLSDQGVRFIRSTPAADPLFLFFAPHAPHEPAVAAPGDRDAFGSLSPWRPESYDEEHVGDKPRWLRSVGRLSSRKQSEIDAFRERQIRSLVGVDRAVGRLVDTLRDEGRLRDTLIVFTSDNGMLWGEHRLFGKSVPYEEATRVPYVVRYDRAIERARVDRRHLVLNLDLAPTFAALAEIEAPGAEGRSFAPILGDPRSGWRSTFLIEHLSLNGNGAPTFCAAHTRTMLLIAYGTGERELYDLRRDPLQLRNRAGDSVYADEERALMVELRELCQPEPPGYDL